MGEKLENLIPLVVITALLVLVALTGTEAIFAWRARYRSADCRAMGRAPYRIVLSDSVVCAPRIGGGDSLIVRLRNDSAR